MSIRKMSLDEYLESERERLVAFERQWRQGMAEKPDYFPGDLDEGLWDEAFRCFDPGESMVDAAPDQPGR